MDQKQAIFNKNHNISSFNWILKARTMRYPASSTTSQVPCLPLSMKGFSEFFLHRSHGGKILSGLRALGRRTDWSSP